MDEKLNLLLVTLNNYSDTKRKDLVNEYTEFRNDYINEQMGKVLSETDSL